MSFIGIPPSSGTGSSLVITGHVSLVTCLLCPSSLTSDERPVTSDKIQKGILPFNTRE